MISGVSNDEQHAAMEEWTAFLRFFVIYVIFVTATVETGNVWMVVILASVVGFMVFVSSLIREETRELLMGRSIIIMPFPGGNELILPVDRSSEHHFRGVTNDVREKWKQYEWRVGSMREDETTDEHQLHANTADDNYGSMDSSSTFPVEAESSDRDQVSLLISKSEGEEGLPLESSAHFDEEQQQQQQQQQQQSCPICLCDYESGEKVIQLPCGHIYHEPCIKSWTDHHDRCPM